MKIINNPATKHLNDVILSNAKNLVFSWCYEILHGACPELNYETLRFPQGDMRRVQDDNNKCRVNNKNGVTLIELIIVVSVIGVLVIALGFSFEGWMGRYGAESQIKEMYTDLMNGKVSAMQKNRMYFISLTTTRYTVYEDTNPAPDGDGVLQTASDRRILLKELQPSSPITWSGDAQMAFNKKGLFHNNDIDKFICSNKDVDADYDCITISALKINTGKLTTRIASGGACNATNCVIK